MVPLHKVGPRDGELWLFLPALAVTLGILGYLAAFLLPRLLSEDETVRAEWTEWRRTVDAEAVVLRQERLLLSSRAGLRPAAEDGGRIPAGSAAALVYDSGADYLRGELLLRLRRALADANADALLRGPVDGYHRPQARLDVVGMVARECVGADAGAGQHGRKQEHFQGSASRISSRRIMPEPSRRAPCLRETRRGSRRPRVPG